jgi:uncharacterized repeat protein (TIGR03847 family)
VPRQIYRYDLPERFVAGTVGVPGERTFYLQASDSGRVTSVLLEKEQVRLLATRLDQLLDEVLRRSGGTAPVPAVTPNELADSAPLDEPVFEQFRVGALALAWDESDQRVVIEAAAIADDAEEQVEPLSDDVEAAGPDVLRVRITGAMARAFATRALTIVSAGRPPCPMCGQPLDATGHVCPRQNGYRRRA